MHDMNTNKYKKKKVKVNTKSNNFTIFFLLTKKVVNENKLKKIH